MLGGPECGIGRNRVIVKTVGSMLVLLSSPRLPEMSTTVPALALAELGAKAQQPVGMAKTWHTQVAAPVPPGCPGMQWIARLC